MITSPSSSVLPLSARHTTRDLHSLLAVCIGCNLCRPQATYVNVGFVTPASWCQAGRFSCAHW